jgi:hypothetical protein
LNRVIPTVKQFKERTNKAGQQNNHSRYSRRPRPHAVEYSAAGSPDMKNSPAFILDNKPGEQFTLWQLSSIRGISYGGPIFETSRPPHARHCSSPVNENSFLDSGPNSRVYHSNG